MHAHGVTTAQYRLSDASREELGSDRARYAAAPPKVYSWNGPSSCAVTGASKLTGNHYFATAGMDPDKHKPERPCSMQDRSEPFRSKAWNAPPLPPRVRDRILLDRTLQWDRDHDCAPNGLAHDRSVPARAALARCYASGFGGSSRRSTPSVRRLRSGPPLRQSGASRRAPATSGLPSAPGQTSSRWPARGPPWVSTELTLARTFTHETN